MRRYAITVTEAQADLLAGALDLLVGLQLGQLKPLAALLAERADIPADALEAARSHLAAAQHALAGRALRAGEAEPVWAAYDLAQVIRHALEIDRSPRDARGGVVGEPLRCAAAVPLAEMAPLGRDLAACA